MEDGNRINKNVYLGDLPSNYLADKGREKLINKIQSSDIKEDENGNCTIRGENIEANACSMLKENYKI